MFFKRLSFAFILACSTLTMVHPKLDVRYLHGCYKNLKTEYRKFSILRGAVALKKIQSKFLFSDEKLLKLLFHHLNLTLVAPAASDRVATYLNIDRITKVLVLMHENFKNESLLELKGEILADYKQKHVKEFTKHLNQFFSTTKDAFKENADNTFEAFLTLAFLKIQSKSELNQYHAALEATLKLKPAGLFCTIEDGKIYEESTAENILTQLTSRTIDSKFIANLSKNAENYEEVVCSLELANQSHGLPQEIDYIFNSEFENNSFPNCFESSLFNFFQALLFDPFTQTCSLENLKNYKIDPHTIDKKLHKFYTQVIQCGDKLISPCNPCDAGSKICQDAFNQVVSNRPWIIYRCGVGQSIKKDNLMRIPDDILKNKQFTDKLKNNLINGIEDSSTIKLFNIASNAKNFIVLLDQLFKLDLFEDSLEKIYFENFEEYYLEKLMKRLGLTYTFEKVINEKITITKTSKYSFELTFLGSHTTYKKQTLAQKEYKLNVHFSEINQTDKLFTQSFVNNLVSQKDKDNFLKDFPDDSFTSELLYFNDLKNEAIQLSLLKTLLHVQTDNPRYLELAKKIILFPQAPLNDPQYRSKVLSLFFKRESFENNNMELYQKNLVFDEDVKMVLICLIALHNDSNFLNSISSFYLGESIFDEKTFFHALVEKTKPEKIIFLIQLMSKYEENNYIITLTHVFLSRYKNTRLAQQVMRIMNGTQNQQTREAFQTALFKNMSDNELLAQAESIVNLYTETTNKSVISHLIELELFEKLSQNGYPMENIGKKLELEFTYINSFAPIQNKKKIEFFRWAIQKNSYINEAVDTAIQSIGQSSEPHLRIIEALLKNNTNDDTIADKLVCTFQNQNILSSSYIINFIKLFLNTNEISKKLILPYVFFNAKKIFQEDNNSSLILFDFLLECNKDIYLIVKLFEEIDTDKNFYQFKKSEISNLDLELAKLLLKHIKQVQHTQITESIFRKVQDELKKKYFYISYEYQARYSLAVEIFKILCKEELIPLKDLCLFALSAASLDGKVNWGMRPCTIKLFKNQQTSEYLAEFLFKEASNLIKISDYDYNKNFYTDLVLSESNRDKFFEYSRQIILEKINTNEITEYIKIVDFFVLLKNISYAKCEYKKATFWEPIYHNFILPSITQLISSNNPIILQKAFALIDSMFERYPNYYSQSFTCHKEFLVPLATNIVERMCCLRENIFCLCESDLISQLNTSPEVLYDYANHFLSHQDIEKYKIGLKTLMLLVNRNFYVQETIHTVYRSIEKNIENDELADLIFSLLENYQKGDDTLQSNLVTLFKQYLEYIKDSNSFITRYEEEAKKRFRCYKIYNGLAKIIEFIYQNSDYSSPDYLLHFAFEPLKLVSNVDDRHTRFLSILHDRKINVELSDQQQLEILNFLRDTITNGQLEYNVILVLRKFIQKSYSLDRVKECIEAFKESNNPLIQEVITRAEEELLAKTSHAGARRARLPDCPTDDGQQEAKKRYL